MTEERKKELIEKAAKDIFNDISKDLPYLKSRLTVLIEEIEEGNAEK